MYETELSGTKLKHVQLLETQGHCKAPCCVSAYEPTDIPKQLKETCKTPP